MLHEFFSLLFIHLVVTAIAEGRRKIVKRDQASDYYLFELTTLPYMSPQTFLTVQEAPTGIEGPEFGEGELDVVIAPPDVTVVSDEKGMDEDDLTESEAMLPDATGEIKIHFNPVESDDMPTTSVPKLKRCTKLKWSKKKAFFLYFPVSKEADTLEDLERKLLGKSSNEIFELFFDEEMLNLLIDQSVLYASQKTCTNLLVRFRK